MCNLCDHRRILCYKKQKLVSWQKWCDSTTVAFLCGHTSVPCHLYFGRTLRQFSCLPTCGVSINPHFFFFLGQSHCHVFYKGCKSEIKRAQFKVPVPLLTSLVHVTNPQSAVGFQIGQMSTKTHTHQTCPAYLIRWLRWSKPCGKGFENVKSADSVIIEPSAYLSGLAPLLWNLT